MICKSLVDKAATVNVRDNDGKTPLHLAAERGLINNVQVLIQYGAYVNDQTYKVGMQNLRLRIVHVRVAEKLLVFYIRGPTMKFCLHTCHTLRR